MAYGGYDESRRIEAVDDSLGYSTRFLKEMSHNVAASARAGRASLPVLHRKARETGPSSRVGQSSTPGNAPSGVWGEIVLAARPI
jgi:hypothetical protein